jgi:hypothetical protein
MDKITRIKLLTVCMLELLGIIVHLYITDKIVSGGIYADTHHTSGAISIIDLMVLGGSVLLFIGAAWLLWAASSGKRKMPENGSRAHNTVLNSTIASMLFLALGLIWPLIIVSMPLSVLALFKSFSLSRTRSYDGYILTCQVINIMILLFVVVGTVMSFHRT